MSYTRRPQPSAALALCLVVLAGSATCAKVNTSGSTPTPTPVDGGGLDTPTPGTDVAVGGVDTMRPIVTEAGVMETGGCTSGITCDPPNGKYCGMIGNGCSGTIDCGTMCPSGQICEDRLCVGSATCVPLQCQVSTGKYCGSVGNGCGRAMDCGGCPANQVCSPSGLCVAGTGCVPSTCNGGASRFCGTIGDGCGGMLDCGSCTAPATCGGRGVPGVCGDPNCVKGTCMPGGGGQYCGTIGDGCGGTLDCSAPCPGGMACGAAPPGGVGIPNVCPGTGPSGPCVGLACMIPTCTGAAKTTLSGTIRDPAGKVPLYNVNVYVPNAPLDPIPDGASCDRCSAQLSGKPIATALTDANGRFVLENVPATQNVPVVIQVGRWRREIRIPSVTACVDNPITDANLTRLPRSKAEGHIPKMALTTGGSDALECLLRKIGIADSEFTTDTGAGRVHLYNGGSSASGSSLGTDRFATTLNGGAVFPQATTLWGSASKMRGYDIVLMSCEGSTFSAIKRPFYPNMKQYGDSGGRIFASHLHFTWLWDEGAAAAWPNTATYTGGSDEDQDPPSFGEAGYVPGTIDTTFPKGAALADWLVAVGATPTRGRIDLWDLAHSVAQVTPPTQRWIYLPTNSRWPSQGASTQYMTFNTPVGAAADAQCGRVVHTDLHVKAAPAAAGEQKDTSEPGTGGTPFPTGCTSVSLSAQEKALEFLFFDLSACVQPDTDRPVPPPVPPPGVPSTPPGVTPVPPPIPPPPPPPPPPPIP